MYEPFFGMERLPFSAMPDPGCFFVSSELQEVLDELTVCVERGQGIGILTASAGIGKTLLCHQLADRLRQRDESRSQFECVCLSNSNFPTRRSLLQAILFEMGDEYSRRDESELRMDLRSRLLSLRPERQALALIVDEAHLFTDELLEELRTLSDLAHDGSSLVRIVLSGQHELEERLTDRKFDALNQRVSRHVYAEPLSVSDSIDYLAHRLQWAGCDIETVFTEEAVSVVARASGGIPRCLNQLADHSLLLSFASDQKPVTVDTVREALEDLKQLPLHWNDVGDGAQVVGFVEEDSKDAANEEPAFSSQSGEDDDNVSDNVTGTTNELFEAQARALSGIVESFRGPSRTVSDDSSRSTVAPLAGGIELDFSGADDSATSEETSASADDALSNDPEETDQVLETLDCDATDHSECRDKGSSSESTNAPDDATESVDQPVFSDTESEETLLQVLPGRNQETLYEKAIDDDSNHDDASLTDEGISIQITSGGVELDDFGPPEEVDLSLGTGAPDSEAAGSEELESGSSQPADSSVIELAFDQNSAEEVDSDSQESTDTVAPAAADADRTASAAEITASLLGQDSVLDAQQTGFAVESSSNEAEQNSAEEDQSQNEIGSAHEEVSFIDEPVVQTDAEPEAVPEQESTDASTGMQSFQPETEPLKNRNTVVIDAAESFGTDYEEELVFDPYAALQEPESAGIVWNVVSLARRTEADSSSHEASGEDDFTEESMTLEGPDDQIENEALPTTDESDFSQKDEPPAGSVISDDFQTASEDSHQASCEISATDSEEPCSENESRFEESDSVETEAAAHCDTEPMRSGRGLILSDGELELESESTIETEAVNDETAHDERDTPAEVADDSATDSELIEAAQSEELPGGEELRQDDVSGGFDVDDVQSESTEIGCRFPLLSDEAHEAHSESCDSTDFHGNDHEDVVEPVELSSARPAQIVDSILPLLDELEDGLESVETRGQADRTVFEIESDLIQSIEHDSDDLEDRIGGAMLDICLDTQSALQDSAAAIRNAEADVDELEDLSAEELGEAADGQLTGSFDSESLDVVQPEPRRRDESTRYQLDPRFREPSTGDSAGETSQSLPQGQNKPFGRLFSELRRRQR